MNTPQTIADFEKIKAQAEEGIRRLKFNAPVEPVAPVAKYMNFYNVFGKYDGSAGALVRSAGGVPNAYVFLSSENRQWIRMDLTGFIHESGTGLDSLNAAIQKWYKEGNVLSATKQPVKIG